MSDDTFIEIGLVGRPHGLRGEVGVDFWAESPELLRGTLWLRPGRGAPRPHTVAAVRRHQGRPLVLFEGIADRSAAETLRGMHVLVPKDRLPEPGEDEVYLHELLGLRVLLHDTGTALGTLDDVQMPGGQEVWSIRTADGKEVLLPAVEEFVASIDLDAREVRITPPPGLLELYLETPDKSAARASDAGKADGDAAGPDGADDQTGPGGA
ncbi:ribosome maturation factor RimM [Nitratidesulfovibrio termitidis]|uniref:ribosome maturation factor RimM n=1 Tax=Nitratidesulfovibrio termitidis TaxID=42252 RepID=UPI00040F7D3A|nr:ribosome maturation factor RimM [Nitratidesulfovibrio termitidis]